MIATTEFVVPKSIPIVFAIGQVPFESRQNAGDFTAAVPSQVQL